MSQGPDSKKERKPVTTPPAIMLQMAPAAVLRFQKKAPNMAGSVKLPTHRVGLSGHAVASRMRANEITFFIVPFDPAYKAGLTGHLPVRKIQILRMSKWSIIPTTAASVPPPLGS
jgi:hypothetical protein